MNQTIDDATGSLQRLTGLSPAALERIIETLVVIILLVLVRLLASTIIRRSTSDPRVMYTWRKVATYVVAAIGFVAVARIWFAWFDDFGTFLGLASAGLAIALRDPIVNVFGWLFIVTRRPFVVGDRIQVGPVAGDVIDQRVFQFTLLEIGNWVQADQSTGRIVHVPNGRVFTDPQFNYTRGFSYIWNELHVTVTFESDWKKAKALLQEVLDRHAEHVSEDAQRGIAEATRYFMIVYSSLTPIIYTEVRESGVLLTMRYLCDPRRRRSTADAIWEDVLAAFAGAPDVAFAYPTSRWFDSAVEGKADLRPASPSSPPDRA